MDILKTKKNVRFTFDSVKEYIESFGYKMLSTEYKNVKQNLLLECPNDHQYEASLNNFKNQNKRCPHCSGNARRTIQYVKDHAIQKGLEVLSDSYKNNSSPLLVRCLHGHEYEVSFSSLQKSKGCSKCQLESIQNAKRFDYDFVKKEFEKAGCTLLSTEYISSTEKMDFICSCNRESQISYNDLRQGGRCRKCMGERISKASRTSFDSVKEIYEKFNCILLSSENEYVNRHSQLKFICSCGNPSISSVHSFKKSGNCYECGMKKMRESLYRNGNTPCSSQQNFIHEVIGGKLNYPVKNYSLDIAFPDEKIYVEYDGGGHDLAVKFGELAQEEFAQKERRRYYSLRSLGWKEIRIVSRNDIVPSSEDILKMMSFARKYLSTHSWIKFCLDENRIESKSVNEEIKSVIY
ncbi:hypothetical protein ABEY43_06490 [Priestia megaterium]